MERKKSSLTSLFASFPKPVEVLQKPKAKPRPKANTKESSTKKLQMLKDKPYRKKKISGALREAVWIKTMGRHFEGKCPVPWCFNSISVFDFQAGHNVPESKGGETKLPNLIPICSRCNTSMGNTYTIDEWSKMHASSEEPQILPIPEIPPETPLGKRTLWQRLFCCFSTTK